MLFASCLALLSPALAAGVDGASIPAWGGGWTGPGDPGARGVLYNPTASGTGEGPELLFDVGVIGLQVGYWPDTSQDPVLVRVPAPHPTITAAFPVGERFGIGTYLHVPYLRSDFTTGLLFVESALLGSWRVNDWLTLGGGLRLGMSRVGATIPLDTATLINDNVELDPPLPEGDPLFQGDQLVENKNKFTASPVLAATVAVSDDVSLHGVVKPPWVVRSRSDILLRPSNEIDVLLEGNVLVRVVLPLRATLAATVRLGRFTLLPEVEYVGWRQTGRVRVDPNDLRIVSSDLVTNSFLAAAGLAEAEFLDVVEGPQRFDLGWRNVVHPAIQVQYEVDDDIDLRAGVLMANAAVGPRSFSEFNLDWTTVSLRVGAGWDVSRRVRLSGTGEWFVSPPRTRRGPGGNLLEFYDLGMWRVGVTTQVFLKPRD